jgi:hypothetical protein
MPRREPVSLPDQQLFLIYGSINHLPDLARSCFLENVFEHLSGKPTDEAVQTAVSVAQQRLTGMKPATPEHQGVE